MVALTKTLLSFSLRTKPDTENCANALIDSTLSADNKINFNMFIVGLNLHDIGDVKRTFNLAFPSAALPASGSLGIISARSIKAPLNFTV
jgi:hypothetical protein